MNALRKYYQCSKGHESVTMSNEQSLQDLLHKIAKEQKIENYELTVKPISSGGANYSSILYVATIANETQHLNLFIKEAAMKEKMREQLPFKIYDTEIYVYSKLKKFYRELEDKYHVPDEYRLYLTKFYGANTTYLKETLVFENLVSRGFSTHDRKVSVDWAYAVAAVTELAKLHSLSISFHKEYSEEFHHFVEEFTTDWVTQEFMDAMWISGFEHSLAVVREENKEKMKRFSAQVDLAWLKRMYQPIRCKVLTHSDFRHSNLMHKRKTDGSVELIVVDHQTIQIGCPVIDLLYLIFTGTDKEFRDAHFDELVQFYYKQLRDAMRRLDIDPETTYSKEDFEFEMKEKLPFGLALAAFALPIVTVDSEHAPELHEDMALDGFKITQTGALFPSRVNGVVDDYVRWGILKD